MKILLVNHSSFIKSSASVSELFLGKNDFYFAEKHNISIEFLCTT